MKKLVVRILPFVSMIIFALVMGSCNQSKSAGMAASENKTVKADADNPIVFKFNCMSKDFENHPPARNLGYFVEQVKQNCGDKIKWEIYFNDSLGSTNEAVIGGLQNQMFEFIDWSTGSFAEYTNTFMPFDVPYLILNNDVANEILSGDVGKLMRDKCIAETGLRPIFYNTIGFRNITANKPIKSPEDLKGMKIRVQTNPLHMKGFSAFGAAPTPIAYAELFTSLQQGVVDGQENPVSNIVDSKLYEVQDYVSMTGHLYTTAPVFMNEEYFQSLPKDIQDGITAAGKATQEHAMKVLLETDKEEIQKLMDEGMKVYRPTNAELAEFQRVAMEKSADYAKIVGEEYFEQIKGMIEEAQKKVLSNS